MIVTDARVTFDAIIAGYLRISFYRFKRQTSDKIRVKHGKNSVISKVYAVFYIAFFTKYSDEIEAALAKIEAAKLELAKRKQEVEEMILGIRPIE